MAKPIRDSKLKRSFLALVILAAVAHSQDLYASAAESVRSAIQETSHFPLPQPTPDDEDRATKNCRKFVAVDLQASQNLNRIFECLHEISHQPNRDIPVLELGLRALELNSQDEISGQVRSAMGSALYNILSMTVASAPDFKTNPGKYEVLVQKLLTAIKALYLEGRVLTSHFDSSPFHTGFLGNFVFVKKTYPQYFKYIGNDVTLKAAKRSFAIEPNITGQTLTANLIVKILSEENLTDQLPAWERKLKNLRIFGALKQLEGVIATIKAPDETEKIQKEIIDLLQDTKLKVESNK